MDKQTTKPDANRGSNSSDKDARRTKKIEELKIISDDSEENEEEVIERWTSFYDGGVLIEFHSLLPQFDKNGALSITKGEQKFCNITEDLFKDCPRIPLKDVKVPERPTADRSKQKRGPKSRTGKVKEEATKTEKEKEKDNTRE